MSLAEDDRVMSGRCGHVLIDQALEARVRAEFRNSPYGAIRAIGLRLHGDVLTLEGSVPSYYFKQIAQRLALNALPDDALIENELQVDP